MKLLITSLVTGIALLAAQGPAVAQDVATGPAADRGARVEARLDRRGDRIERRTDHRGDRIDRQLDRRGERVDRRHDRAGNRIDRVSDRRQRHGV